MKDYKKNRSEKAQDSVSKKKLSAAILMKEQTDFLEDHLDKLEQLKIRIQKLR
ncbi:MAG: hypothetical protein AAF611_11425 [Bacteroidota bacterium]